MGWWGGDDWRHYRRRSPRRVKDGIRTRSRQGEIGKTWWSRRWLGTLESYGWSNRLQRGRSYARKGQVVSFELSRSRVDSQVQGSMPKPYRVTIGIKPLIEKKWREISVSLASKAVFASKLLAGEMPGDIEEAFSRSSVTLFPTKRDIEMDCSCPDYASPCKHIAAVYYILAEEFDRDPFMMFLLRGKTKEELMAALREVRKTVSGHDAGEPKPAVTESDRAKAPPLEACIAHFWSAQRPMGHTGVSRNGPYVNAAVIKRLGEPPFWREPEDFAGVMEDIYRSVTQKAIQLAFS